MRLTVLTLTRDRLEYTRECFRSLETNAGCSYRHLVLDQGSEDGTPEWLREWRNAKPGLRQVIYNHENIGIGKGLNALLAIAGENDVICKFDNDCHINTPNTLKIAAHFAINKPALVSPTILGLNRPPQPVGVEFAVRVGDETVLGSPMGQIGGIFMAAPARLWDGWRYPNDLPVYGEDDSTLCIRAATLFRMPSVYLNDYTATHHETTAGQHDRYPDYFQRTSQEGKPSL